MKKVIKLIRNRNGCSRCRKRRDSLRCIPTQTESCNIVSQRINSEFSENEEDASPTSSSRPMLQYFHAKNHFSSISSPISIPHHPESEDNDSGEEESCSLSEEQVSCEEESSSSLPRLQGAAERYPSNNTEANKCFVFNEPHKTEMVALRDRPMLVGGANCMSYCDESDVHVSIKYKGVSIPKHSTILMTVSWVFTLIRHCVH